MDTVLTEMDSVQQAESIGGQQSFQVARYA